MVRNYIILVPSAVDRNFAYHYNALEEQLNKGTIRMDTGRPNFWINIRLDGNELKADVFESQAAAAKAIGHHYLDTLYSVKSRTGRIFGHLDLQDLYDSDEFGDSECV